MNISFFLQNPDASPKNAPNVYPGMENTLELEFLSSQSGIQFQPQDRITLYFPVSLLAPMEAGQMSSPEWQVLAFTPPGQTGSAYIFELSPKAAITFNGPITIRFEKIQVTDLGTDEVSAQYKIAGRNYSGNSAKLFAQNPPGTLSNLPDVLTFTAFMNQNATPNEAQNSICLSDNSLKPPIANQLHLNLNCALSQLATGWADNKQPRFVLSFSYGTDENALTDALKATDPGTAYNPLTSAWNIENTVPGTQWHALTPNSSNSTPSWIIEPADNNQSLFDSTHPNLDVLFGAIISILPPGDATLYIQWIHIPGYSDGYHSLPIPKKTVLPKVVDFSADQGQKSINLPAGTPAALQWSCFGAYAVQLEWYDAGNHNKQVIPLNFDNPALLYSGNFQLLTQSNTCSVTLRALGPDGRVSEQSEPVIIYRIPTVQEFSVALLRDTQGAYLQFNWATGNANTIDIEGVVQGLGTSSEQTPYQLRLSDTLPLQHDYWLRAKGDNNQVARKRIYAAPTVEQFVALPGLSDNFYNMYISGNGQTIYVTGDINQPFLYSFDARNPPAAADHLVLNLFADCYVSSILVTPDNKRAFLLFSAYNDGYSSFILYCDPKDLNHLQDYRNNIIALPHRLVSRLQWYGSGQVILTSRDNPGYGIFDSENPPASVPFVQVAGDFDASGFSVSLCAPDRLSGFYTDDYKTMGWFNGQSIPASQPQLYEEHWAFRQFCVNPNGQNAFVIGGVNSTRFDIQNGQLTGVPVPITVQNALSCAIAPNGRTLLVFSLSGISAYDTKNPAAAPITIQPNSQTPIEAVFMPDGARYFVITQTDDTRTIAVMSFHFLPD